MHPSVHEDMVFLWRGSVPRVRYTSLGMSVCQPVLNGRCRHSHINIALSILFIRAKHGSVPASKE